MKNDKEENPAFITGGAGIDKNYPAEKINALKNLKTGNAYFAYLNEKIRKSSEKKDAK